MLTLIFTISPHLYYGRSVTHISHLGEFHLSPSYLFLKLASVDNPSTYRCLHECRLASNSPSLSTSRTFCVTLLVSLQSGLMDAGVRKRKQRAILSCIDCRRRKLKCDRESPCNRCVGGGYPERCAYSYGEEDERTAKSSKRVTVREVESVEAMSPEKLGSDGRIEHLERQIAELQESMKSMRDSHTSVQKLPGCGKECRGVDETDRSAVLTGLFKGRGVKTFYYGISSPVIIVAHVGSTIRSSTILW